MDALKRQAELEWAKHFMQWATSKSLEPACKPDAPGRVSRKGGYPDFIFVCDGDMYVLELTYLLIKELWEIQCHVDYNIAASLKGKLPGTFILEIPIESLSNFKGRRIPKSKVIPLIKEIESRASTCTGSPKRKLALSSDFTLRKIEAEGSQLYPRITQNDLPPELSVNDPSATKLKHQLKEIIEEANDKFRGFKGARVLVLDTSQCGLDIEYHKEIVSQWCKGIEHQILNFDYVCLDPGAPMWQGSNGARALTGHQGVGKHIGNCKEVWRREGLPKLPKLPKFPCTDSI